MSRYSVQKRLTIAAIIMALSVLFSRILGFVRDAVIAYLLGAGAETDAYFAAFTLPDLMNYFLAGGAMSITFVPLYGRRIGAGDHDGANKLVSVVGSTMAVMMVGFIIVGLVFTDRFVPLLCPGFSPEAVERTVFLTRIVIPGQIFFFLGGILSAILLVHERFKPVAMVPIVYNLCIIVFGIALNSRMGVAGFSVGALIGAVLGPFAIPLWSARKLVKVRFHLSFRDTDFKEYIKLSLPVMAGVTLLTADEWLGRYFGSMMGEATISWLQNARRLMLVPMALIGQAAGQAALPFLTKLAAEGRRRELGETLSGTVRATVFLSTIAAGALAVLALPTVMAIFERGAFSPTDTAATASILLAYCPGLIAWACQVVAVRGFYAHADTLRPMFVGSIVTVIALPVYALLASEMGPEGLALATSFGLTLNAIGTMAVLQRTYHCLSMRSILSGLMKGLAVAGLMALPLWALSDWLRATLPHAGWTPWVTLMVCGTLLASGAMFIAGRLGGAEAAVVKRMVGGFRRRLFGR